MDETVEGYIEVGDMERLLKTGGAVTLIDARTPEEFAAGHVPGAINVPIADLADFAKNPTKGIVATMCGSTGRGERAAAILASHGVEDVRIMNGGLKAWKEAGFSVG